MNRLLASDLDGTLIPPTAALEQLARIERFAAAVGTAHLHLAYVTGRHLELTLDGVQRFGLPIPEVLACDVGTTVYWLRDGRWLPDQHYEANVGASPGTAGAGEVKAALGSFSSLHLQEEEKQAPFKVSYYVDLGDVAGGATSAASDELLAALAERLRSVAQVRLVFSRDPLDGRGLLDVLPEAVGKLTAVEHIARSMGVERADTVYAGDSGNDRDAFLSGLRSIVVANAHQALKEDVRRAVALAGVEELVYFATTSYSEGVLEGLRHFEAIEL